MIVRNLSEIERDHTVRGETWTSRRLLLAGDGVGFSMHDTVLAAGTTTQMWYRNHIEAVYCIEGKGAIRDLATGVDHAIEPGTLYCLNEHDQHILYAHSELRVVCVFNPPVVGPETHDADGAYPLLSPEDVSS